MTIFATSLFVACSNAMLTRTLSNERSSDDGSIASVSCNEWLRVNWRESIAYNDTNFEQSSLVGIRLHAENERDAVVDFGVRHFSNGDFLWQLPVKDERKLALNNSTIYYFKVTILFDHIERVVVTTERFRIIDCDMSKSSLMARGLSASATMTANTSVPQLSPVVTVLALLSMAALVCTGVLLGAHCTGLQKILNPAGQDGNNGASTPVTGNSKRGVPTSGMPTDPDEIERLKQRFNDPNAPVEYDPEEVARGYMLGVPTVKAPPELLGTKPAPVAQPQPQPPAPATPPASVRNAGSSHNGSGAPFATAVVNGQPVLVVNNYICGACQKSYFYNEDLIEHVKLRHPSQKRSRKRQGHQ